jgi:hypothetical protein
MYKLELKQNGFVMVNSDGTEVIRYKYDDNTAANMADLKEVQDITDKLNNYAILETELETLKRKWNSYQAVSKREMELDHLRGEELQSEYKEE